MYQIRISTAFKKDVKSAQKRGYDIGKLKAVIDILSSGRQLPAKNHDHILTGNLKGYRECHIEPDWLLIYRIKENELLLSATGTHSDLFNK